MMMLIIFLITDISMVGIFAGVYGNIAKYREGMLMGVHPACFLYTFDAADE